MKSISALKKSDEHSHSFLRISMKTYLFPRKQWKIVALLKNINENTSFPKKNNEMLISLPKKGLANMNFRIVFCISVQNSAIPVYH